MRWAIYYADGSFCSSIDRSPADAPGLGVIVIVQENEDPQERPYLQHMTDYYIWKGVRWQGCDLFGLWEYLFVDKPDYEKAFCAGRTVSNSEYMEIRARAKELRDKWYDHRDV